MPVISPVLTTQIVADDFTFLELAKVAGILAIQYLIVEIKESFPWPFFSKREFVGIFRKDSGVRIYW